MSDIEQQKADGPTPSRRTVVRTAAHAAWLVPAISLVTEAPALAASGDTIQFGAGTASWSGVITVLGQPVAGIPTLNLSVPIILGSTRSSMATSLTVVVSFPSSLSQNLTPHAPSGWKVTPTGAGTGPFTFTLNSNPKAPTTVTFAPTFTGSLAVLSYPLPKGSAIGLTASSASSNTSPPPVGFTSTGTTSGTATVPGSVATSN